MGELWYDHGSSAISSHKILLTPFTNENVLDNRAAVLQ